MRLPVYGCMGPSRDEAKTRADTIFNELMVTLKQKYGIDKPDGEWPKMVESWEQETAQLKEIITDMVFSNDIANF